ncbi:archaeosortase A [Haloglomus halophilum]|uniref:archaeosortase A n=1 Tax=Haloglomus halophilum TaxID=2962672 RepID=UPI0020C9EC25|nr:archaeosortase A [Haloglomus halophilum]
MSQALTDALAWISIAAFVVAALAELRDRRTASLAAAGAWTLFAVFWLALIPQFLLVEKSAIEGVLSALAVPASLSAAYLLYRGRASLLVLTRGVAVMGLIYLPATTIPWLYGLLIETTTAQTDALIRFAGYDPTVATNEAGLRNTFIFTTGGHQYETFIILACTGLGSMAIFAGLIAAVRAPLRRKLAAFAVSVPVIWVLNLVRNAFIAVAFGKQWFQVAVPQVSMLFGIPPEESGLVSFYLADKVIAQSASVVALVLITYPVVRALPELAGVLDDALYVVTYREFHIAEALGLEASDAGAAETTATDASHAAGSDSVGHSDDD